MPYAAVAFHDHAHAPFSRNRSAGYLHARRFSSSRSALAERCAAPIQTLMAGIPRNFEVFDPLDFLAEATQHIPHRVKNIIKSVRLGTGTLYTAEAKLTIKAGKNGEKPSVCKGTIYKRPPAPEKSNYLSVISLVDDYQKNNFTVIISNAF